MAKASEADLAMAMELTNALEAISQRWTPSMPESIKRLGADDEYEPFDPDNAEQCIRVVAHLRKLMDRGSLMRVVWGAAIMLDPRNKMVDPNSDIIEHYPERVELERLKTSNQVKESEHG